MTREPVPPPREWKQSIRLCANHPHRGKTGNCTLLDGKPKTVHVLGRDFIHIELGDDLACGAEPHEIKYIYPTSPPSPTKKT